jgi:hypothetical protein
MKLKSFGCSFIYGDDLSDTFKLTNPWSVQTWPALLAKHYQLPYQCYAQSGAGNLQISRAVLQELANPEPAVFVIGWTWIDRFDYINSINNVWQTVRPSSSTEAAQLYYKWLHSQYTDKLLNLTEIFSVLCLLQQQNRKYIMTCQDPLLFETTWHCDSAIELLQQQILPKITWFENQTFLQWSKTNQYSISENWHPLEDAHRAAADLLINYCLV